MKLKRYACYVAFLATLALTLLVLVMWKNTTYVEDVRTMYLDLSETLNNDQSNIKANFRDVKADNIPLYSSYSGNITLSEQLTYDLKEIGLLFTDFNVVGIKQVDDYLSEVTLQTIYYDVGNNLKLCTLTCNVNSDFEISKYEIEISDYVEEEFSDEG